jgi:hypothetical protein
MIVFCHIPKTAGMAVADVLKYHFGNKYLHTTGWKIGSRYTENHLKKDLFVTLNKIKCVGGHGLRPFLDLGEISNNFKWFTMLRDPLSRVLSHYVYDVENSKGKWPSLPAWMKDGHDNYQCRWIAGQAKSNLAIEILKNKFVSVGLQEQFKDSMLHFSNFMGWREVVIPEKLINPSRDTVLKNKAKKELYENYALFEDLNSEDIHLYDFTKTHIWPSQMDFNKSREIRVLTTPSKKHTKHYRENMLFRNYIYKPFLFLVRNM